MKENNFLFKVLILKERMEQVKEIESSPIKKSFDFSIEALLGKRDECWGNVRKVGVIPTSKNASEVKVNHCDFQFHLDTLEGSGTPRVNRNISERDFESESDSPKEPFRGECEPEKSTFAWLSCTRFKPPKLLRSRKRTSIKRNGRGPRIPFSTHQLAILEKSFLDSQYLSGSAISKLADSLRLTETRVKIWFQNRRARFRRENNSPVKHDLCLPPIQGKFLKKLEVESKPQKQQENTQKRHFTTGGPMSINKESFRHLINDLNLMAANTSNSTRFNISAPTPIQYYSTLVSSPPFHLPNTIAQLNLQTFSSHSNSINDLKNHLD